MLLPFLIAWVATRINRHQDHVIWYLREENRILKAKLKGKRMQLTDTERRRLAVLAHPIDRKRLKEIVTIATVDTLQRWYRRLVIQTIAPNAHGKSPGRPRVDQEIERLAVRMVHENPRWGYRRIQGALSNLGHHIDNTTVRNIWQRNHVDPAPIRGRAGMRWSQFLTLHLEVLAASGFFKVRQSAVVRLWITRTRIGCNLSAQGRQLLGFFLHGILSTSTREAQQWHWFGSRCLPPVDPRYHLIFGRRRGPDGLFQSATPQVQACLVEQKRSPPEARVVLIRPGGDRNGGRDAPDALFVTGSHAERARGQRWDQRHLTTVEDGVKPVAA
jgi:hypothetical protein